MSVLHVTKRALNVCFTLKIAQVAKMYRELFTIYIVLMHNINVYRLVQMVTMETKV